MGVLLLCTLALGVLASGKDNDRPEVETQYGKLQGKTLSVKGTEKTVQAFYGVPFAKPPVGSLRFAAPEPPEPWKSTKDATGHAPLCLQDHKLIKLWLLDLMKFKFTLPPMSEDCLYLNIFTPADRTKQEKLPVMVFIHGGALVMGGAMIFEGSALSAYENVVVVSIQYRLGLLGFFSTGDNRAPGNYGFLDQVAALRWIKENIADFGGDPHKVTIFGQSAGGYSVSALVLSPLAKGLFHRAIAESGVALMPDVVVKSKQDFKSVKNIMAQISGCDVDMLLDCLMAKSEEEIKSISSSMEMMSRTVTIDGEFLPKAIEEIFANKEVNSVPFMTGFTNQEFGWIVPTLFNISRFRDGMERKTVEEIIRKLPLLRSFSSAVSHLMDEYIGEETIPAEIYKYFLDLAGDLVFVIPALKAAKHHRDSGHPTYLYEFQHRASLLEHSRPDYVKADHCDELFFLMGGPFLEDDYVPTEAFKEKEKILSKKMMKYWANFARTGNPNGPGLVHWPPYDHKEGYMEINQEQRASKQLKAGKYTFWTKELPQKIKEEKEKHTEL